MSLKAFQIIFTWEEFPDSIGFAESASKLKSSIAYSAMDAGYVRTFMDGVRLIKSCRRAKEFDVLTEGKDRLNSMDLEYATLFKQQLESKDEISS